MRNQTKMWLCMVGLYLFGFIHQIIFEARYSFVVAGTTLFGIGFGWYACKSIQDRDKIQNEKTKRSKGSNT